MGGEISKLSNEVKELSVGGNYISGHFSRRLISRLLAPGLTRQRFWSNISTNHSTPLFSVWKRHSRDRPSLNTTARLGCYICSDSHFI